MNQRVGVGVGVGVGQLENRADALNKVNKSRDIEDIADENHEDADKYRNTNLKICCRELVKFHLRKYQNKNQIFITIWRWGSAKR